MTQEREMGFLWSAMVKVVVLGPILAYVVKGMMEIEIQYRWTAFVSLMNLMAMHVALEFYHPVMGYVRPVLKAIVMNPPARWLGRELLVLLSDLKYLAWQLVLWVKKQMVDALKWLVEMTQLMGEMILVGLYSLCVVLVLVLVNNHQIRGDLCNFLYNRMF